MTIEAIPFWVVQDHKENRRKCTVEPLRGAPGLELLRLGKPRPGESMISVPSGILLAVDAPVLTRADRALLDADDERRCVVLDGSWARLTPLCQRLDLSSADVLERRSLPRELQTAYPRTSKLWDDPSGGLATIEAMYAATVILGAPRPDLLEHYHWADEFHRRNDALWSQSGG